MYPCLSRCTFPKQNCGTHLPDLRDYTSINSDCGNMERTMVVHDKPVNKQVPCLLYPKPHSSSFTSLVQNLIVDSDLPDLLSKVTLVSVYDEYKCFAQQCSKYFLSEVWPSQSPCSNFWPHIEQPPKIILWHIQASRCSKGIKSDLVSWRRNTDKLPIDQHLHSGFPIGLYSCPGADLLPFDVKMRNPINSSHTFTIWQPTPKTVFALRYFWDSMEFLANLRHASSSEYGSQPQLHRIFYWRWAGSQTPNSLWDYEPHDTKPGRTPDTFLFHTYS